MKIVTASCLTTGNITLLYVLLVLRLQARLPTIYQSRNSYLYYFTNEGVFVVPLTHGLIATEFKSQVQPTTWCLIDSNQSLNMVPVFIQDLDIFTVQASSPRPHCFRWMNKATRRVTQYFMEPWTLPELFVGYVTHAYSCKTIPKVPPLSRVLQHTICSKAQIEFFCNRYGTSPRLVYTNAQYPSSYDTLLLESIATINYQRLDSLLGQTSALDLSALISQQLVRVSPGATRDAFETSFPTRYIYEKLRDNLSNSESGSHKLPQASAMARLYEMSIRIPNA